jgi:hypothetical protein
MPEYQELDVLLILQATSGTEETADGKYTSEGSMGLLRVRVREIACYRCRLVGLGFLNPSGFVNIQRKFLRVLGLTKMTVLLAFTIAGYNVDRIRAFVARTAVERAAKGKIRRSAVAEPGRTCWATRLPRLVPTLPPRAHSSEPNSSARRGSAMR